jgi:hypothetical protein
MKALLQERNHRNGDLSISHGAFIAFSRLALPEALTA